MKYRSFAILGAGTLHAKVFREYLDTHPLPGVHAHLFGDDEMLMTASGEAADFIQPESPEEVQDFPLLVDFKCGRSAAIAAAGKILASGTIVPPDGAALVLFGANESRLLAHGSCTAPHPLSSVLLRALGGRPISGLAAGHIVALTSTEEEGQEGQDELFNQTVALINTGSFKPKVYKEQVAYNLVPTPGESLPARVHAEVENFLGKGWLAPVQTARAGTFFGTLAAIHLEFGSPDAKAAFLRTRQTDPALVWQPEGCRGLVHAVQEEGIFISTAAETGRSLQLWIACDPLRAGMAWNLAGLVEQFFQHYPTN